MKTLLLLGIMTLIGCNGQIDVEYYATYNGKTTKVQHCIMYDGYMSVRKHSGSYSDVRADDMVCETKYIKEKK